MAGKDYVLNKGQVFFAPFSDVSSSYNTAGEYYLGNAPSFKLTTSTDGVEHFASTDGTAEMDDYAITKYTRTGQVTIDHIAVDNLAMYLTGGPTLVSRASQSVSETITGITQHRWYKVGVSEQNPAGHSGISGLVITGKTLGVDYDTLDLNAGMFRCIAAVSNTSWDVSYTVQAGSIPTLLSSNRPWEGTLRFNAKPLKGPAYDYFIPHALVVPDSDLDLIADDWQSIGLSFKIKKRSDRAAIYCHGRPWD